MVDEPKGDLAQGEDNDDSPKTCLPTRQAVPRPTREVVRRHIDDRAAAAAIGALAFAGSSYPLILSFPLSADRRPGLHLGLDPAQARFPVTRDRLDGLREAWQHGGRSWSQMRVAVCAANTATDAVAAIKQALSSGEPLDAVAAMSDELALAAIDTLATAGRPVPTAVAVTGWDDTPAAAAAGLSTIHQNLHAQGARCAHLALSPQPETAHQAPPDWNVVPRTSTRMAPCP